MTLQARFSENDSRLYSPNRDVAHNFEFVIKETADRLESDRWEALQRMLSDSGVSKDDLGEACRVVIEFVASAAKDNPEETMFAALDRTGWWDLPGEAHVAIMAVIGSVMLGIYWVGVREATIGGDGPCHKMDYLVSHGREAAKLIAMPAWRRPIYRFSRRLLRAYRAIMSND